MPSNAGGVETGVSTGRPRLRLAEVESTSPPIDYGINQRVSSAFAAAQAKVAVAVGYFLL